MWLSLLSLLLAIAGSRPALAQDAGVSRDSAAIIGLELEMAGLLERGAFDEYARHLTTDYVRTTAAGRLETRDQALDAWRARGRSQPMNPTQMWVRVYGDAAVLTAAFEDADGATVTRITKTFVRVDGEWKLLALHTSRVSDSP